MRGQCIRLCFVTLALAGVVQAAHAETVPPALPAGRSAQLPPTPPVPKPPTEIFRELLAMNSSERETALALRNPDQRRVIFSKLQEYEAMIPEERELRLKVTELRWHLIPLLKISPAERRGRLELLASEDRNLIEERLQQWDRLPQATQRQLLEHETTILYLLRLESGTVEQREELLKTLSPERRQRIEEQLGRWRALPSEQRTRMYEHFHQFFELNERERERTLNTLSTAEREQMEQTLRKFERLPPAQRRHCIESFRKFANLSHAERQQFLTNAQRWEAMSPSERQAWRNLVDRLPLMPPLPPGFNTPPTPPTLNLGSGGGR